MTTRGVGVVVCLLGAAVVARLLVGIDTVAARSAGPPVNRNGVSGQYCTLCHTTNALNSGEGSVRVIGLPSAWLPGETYAIQVIVSHPSARRSGFQMSAVTSSGEQAGQFVVGADGRSQVETGDVNGKPVQFIHHNSLGSAIDGSNVFQFTYQTPSDGGVGNIRFNVAGNAANGDGTNRNDFIYAAEIILPPLTATDQLSFALAARGAYLTSTSGAGNALAIGHARMQTSRAGVGMALISYRPGGTLVSETASAATAPMRSGRIYAEVDGSINTGVAVVNPNAEAAVVNYFFTDDGGSDFGASSVTIPPNSQVAAFLNQAPFYAPGPLQLFQKPISSARTFTFNSNVAVSVLAVRSRMNERGQFMIAGLPVADLSSNSTTSIAIPQIAEGGGWNSELLLVNPTDSTLTGTIRFHASSGQPLSVSVNDQTASQFDYTIPARSSRRYRTAGTGTSSRTGSIQISPTANSRTPAAVELLALRANNVTVSETGIIGSSPGNVFRVFAESSGNFNAREPGASLSTVAVSNHGSDAVAINIEATNADGSPAGQSTTVSIPARGQLGLSLEQIPGLTPAAFKGVVWVSAPAGSSVAVAGLRARYNERSTPDLLVTAFPAFDEATTSATEFSFPQVVESGDYSTRFVLLGGRSGPSSGSLQFLSQAGLALRLTMR